MSGELSFQQNCETRWRKYDLSQRRIASVRGFSANPSIVPRTYPSPFCSLTARDLPRQPERRSEQKANMLRFCTWFFERAQLR